MTDEEIREHMADLAANVAEQVANRFDRLWRDRTDELDHKWSEKVEEVKLHVDVRLNGMQVQIQAVAEQHAHMVERLSNLEIGQERIKEELQDTRAELRADIRRVESPMDSMEAGIERVETKLDRVTADHEGRIATLEARA